MKLHNFQIRINPTIEEFEQMKYLDRRIFRETARNRFTRLDSDYINKKYKEERFPTEGNNLLGKLMFKYLKDNTAHFKRKKEIILMDVGAAGGALTTIFALKALNILGLLDKTKIILIDIAKEALHSTLVGNFVLSDRFIEEYNLKGFGDNGKGIKKLLSKSKYFCSDLINLPNEINNVDICISGFTHHHLNIFDKKLACREMERVTRKNGFIGIVDESLNYYQYLEWLNQHKDEINCRKEKVPIAQESFIGLSEHISLFSDVKILSKNKSDKYYCISMKKIKNTQYHIPLFALV